MYLIATLKRYLLKDIQANKFMLKVNRGNIRKRCEMSSKLKIKTSKHDCDVFTGKFEHNEHLFVMF